MAERKPAATDPGDATTQDVELLARDRLGGVRQEGEVDVRRLAMVPLGRGAKQRPRFVTGGRYRDGGRGPLAAGAIATAARRPLPFVRSPRPASSANVTSDSGTSGSPRRTRARYSPVADPGAAATFSGVPSAMIRPPARPPRDRGR